ncbi:DoxX family protein [Actinomadura viridis]|uniref:Membrane protein n=1 Tax=Actinomadura viridis TaxID=58110 RepID=A0A931GNW0_9ACTN|nr:DoxX family protein [Actinomadura viridis]MBG6086794.1 putative membrane protein [Actinomadura viridis]
MPSSTRPARALAAFLATAGTTHFLAPEPYDAIIPAWVPGKPRTWTHLSGVAELACAAAVACPRTRRAGALASAALFAAVFPGNVQMAYDWRHRPLPQRAAAYGRLPLQAPLIAWALAVARKDVSGRR